MKKRKLQETSGGEKERERERKKNIYRYFSKETTSIEVRPLRSVVWGKRKREEGFPGTHVNQRQKHTTVYHTGYDCPRRNGKTNIRLIRFHCGEISWGDQNYGRHSWEGCHLSLFSYASMFVPSRLFSCRAPLQPSLGSTSTSTTAATSRLGGVSGWDWSKIPASIITPSVGTATRKSTGQSMPRYVPKSPPFTNCSFGSNRGHLLNPTCCFCLRFNVQLLGLFFFVFFLAH